MTITHTTAGDGLKDQINGPASSIEQAIQDAIQNDLLTTGTTAATLLGELVWPFVGLNAPVHVGFEDDEGGGSVATIQEIIAHFANRENLKGWPEQEHSYVLTTLYYLLRAVKTIRKRNDILFHLANLYRFNQQNEHAHDLLDNLDGYYIGTHNRA